MTDLLLFFQIEQEMELIVNRTGMFFSFSNEWRVKWIPSVMMYCKNLKQRKDIAQTIATYDDSYSTGI